MARNNSGRALAFRNFKTGLAARSDNFANLLPEHVDLAHFGQGLQALVERDPKLLNNPAAFWRSAYDLAAAGVEIAPSAKEGCIVRFGGTPTPIIQYRGLVRLALRSPDVLALNCELVREADGFRYWTDNRGPHIQHERKLGSSRSPIAGAYATANLRGGGFVVAVMDSDEIEAIRARAPGKNSPAWTEHRGEKYKITAVRRLCKMLPQSTMLQRAINVVDAEFRPAAAPAFVDPTLASLGVVGEVVDAEVVADTAEPDPAGMSPEDIADAEALERAAVAGESEDMPDAGDLDHI